MLKIGIVGYGKLGKAVERNVELFPDIELLYVFSRRAGSIKIRSGAKVCTMEQAVKAAPTLDCVIICLSSEKEATEAVSTFAKLTDTVDAFDMHRDSTKHRKIAENAAKNGKKVSVVMSGWDPGLLSLERLLFSAFMPSARISTFWGPGVSQGHSNALVNVRGVRKAVQYTIPVPEAIAAAEGGRGFEGHSHRRVCYIVCDNEAEASIAETVKESDYFVDSEPELHFISEEEFDRDHSSAFHQGELIASHIKNNNEENYSFARLVLNIASNPDFTASVLLATARAAVRLEEEGNSGAFTLFDIPPRLYFRGDIDRLI